MRIASISLLCSLVPWALLSLGAGCDHKKLGIEGASCTASADCEGDLQCLESVCRDVQTPPPTAEDDLRAQVEKNTQELVALREELGLKGKPTTAECQAFADKIIALTLQGQTGEAEEMVRSMIEETRPDVIQECRTKGTKAEIDCALRAHSLDDLQRCDRSR